MGRKSNSSVETIKNWKPVYEPWRHGGWYVINVPYPSGAAGCVSRNYDDGKWRVVCESSFGEGRTFATRNEAAYAELATALAERLELIAKRCREAAIAFDGTEAAIKFGGLASFSSDIESLTEI